MTSNHELDLARIPALLRDHVGIDPNDVAAVLDLAAIGITNDTWRNSPLEDWHGAGRIHDGGMLRANVATTKLVRSVLDDHLDDTFTDAGEELIATKDFAALDTDFTDDLFADMFEWLSDPDRVLPDGRTLGQLAGEDLDELVDHMDRALGGIAASAERHGLDFVLQRAAVHGGWHARTGGGRLGGPTSWPSSSPAWTTRGIPTGVKAVSGIWVCQPSQPR